MNTIMQLSALLLAFFTQTTLATWPKRGVPFNDVSLIQQFNGGGSEVNWAWNWDSYMPNSFPTTMEFIPCLWSDSSDHTSNWAANVNAAIARGTGHVMAFNEPDACGGDQSCMSPQQAVNAWKTYIQPFAGRVALGAPQVTNGASGLPWLESFLSLCTGCQIDFVPIHWYEGVGGQNYLADFYNYVGAAYAAGGNRPIWVTEFALWNPATEADQEYFIGQVMPWMDNLSWVSRYSWFMCTSDRTLEPQGSLCNADGSLSTLGNVYTYSAF
ncbi:hypothetical protein BCIN_02g00700 [Botrytis cinerea B05.10]|uniref:Asl1-like glycosyl hydrolase catalytic domain-containing protein n=2 Tax=Botryotinia fuckeliana TaxID=40559 RepID=A0A384J886_BOTFB|nr:hypothetical protein BCIN_02g00700 [Botrytis cinerea B05.10]ATZ46691.1 hypothetical protein BCIN_02g00700 [Botrytis cinerea B05.10]EMR84865.1 putative uncharacterized serine-rich protein [Botrytis cinerea BcDW1]